MEWTKEQLQAIEAKGNNILVSAAAGSGKTTVLVQRIINKILKENVDIDKLLVCTFTNAAAAEMKQKLLDKLYEEVDKDPENEILARQISLINRAHISTIHSFCLDVIRNNFFELGIPANFRIADPAEDEIMKEDSLEEIFERNYEKEDKDFLSLVDLYTSYKSDDKLKEIVTKVYNFCVSSPNPEKWLEDAIEAYKIDVNDFKDTPWGRKILENAKETVEDNILSLKDAVLKTEGIVDLEKYNSILKSDLNYLESIDFSSWDSAYNVISQIEFLPWNGPRSLSDEEKFIKDQVKEIRDEANKKTKKIKDIISLNTKDALDEIRNAYKILDTIRKLVLEFNEEYTQRKREKNILTFSDIEHLALKLLIDDEGNKTEIAKNYDFNEIMIDEYQDSSIIQEKILNSVSNGKNIFMVGDVKQSIYRFRQARPDLFMSKYDTYKKSDTNDLTEPTKILLHKNFRSRDNVLDFTNIVFQNIMSKNLGEIEYNEEEYLNLGRELEKINLDCKTELYMIETDQEDSDNEYDEAEDNSESSNQGVQNTEILSNLDYEARLIGSKIRELVSQGFKYRDICILLKSANNDSPIYEKELRDMGIPVYAESNSDYLSSIEISTILSLLKIIDNPLQDIPLVTVLRSKIGSFTDNELIEIRDVDRNKNFYNALEEYLEFKNRKEELAEKIKAFIDMLNTYRKLEKEITLDELIWKIYSDTGYYNYVRLMPNGILRQANLRKLFEEAKAYEEISYKGLFNFILFIEKVSNKDNNDMSSAKIIGEKDDVVRIMTIHKSKGLEFPIVFIGTANKKANLQDLNDKIILDPDMGIGIKDTLTKDAVKLKLRKESISEEMRVLYVALTRAKEKLYIVSSGKDIAKKVGNKVNEIRKYHGENRPEKINYNLVNKYDTYLDWILLSDKFSSKMDLDVKVISFEDLKKTNEEHFADLNKEKVNESEVYVDTIKKRLNSVSDEELKRIDSILNWEYPNKDAINLETKTSVTAIKKKENKAKENNDENNEENSLIELKVPDFIIDENNQEQGIKEKTGAALGTLIHLALEKLEDDDIDGLIDILNVEEEDRNTLRKYKYILENYVRSDLFKEIIDSKEVYHETPFYMHISPVNSVDNENKNNQNNQNKILVQGIIDLYYITKDDKLVLCDYKTDKLDKEEDFILRYKEQLNLYKEALEKALLRKVDKTIIYSTSLNKMIEIY